MPGGLPFLCRSDYIRATLMTRAGDLIWIHDYHLLLVPSLLRQTLPEAAIGLFVHTPFPSSEIFRCLPRRKEILDGMLGANLICFQVSCTSIPSAYARRLCVVISTWKHVADGSRSSCRRTLIRDISRRRACACAGTRSPTRAELTCTGMYRPLHTVPSASTPSGWRRTRACFPA